MNKILMVSALVLSLLGSNVFAASGKKATATATPTTSSNEFERKYGMAGCGLGSQVMGRQGSQILASTTNGTSANQLFGITSGTSNCIDSDKEEVAHRMDRFIQVNKVALASDMARGEGESLQALASIAGCMNGKKFNSVMQKNFGSIYPDVTVQSMDVTDAVINVILKDQSLKGNCSLVG